MEVDTRVFPKFCHFLNEHSELENISQLFHFVFVEISVVQTGAMVANGLNGHPTIIIVVRNI